MAWDLLLKSDIGLLSLFTIVFIIAMAVFIAVYAKKHMAIDDQAAAAAPKGPQQVQ
ncbi:MAG: DUF3149 domain-containing protein [Zoogloeaceae bacterium]|nr:DUF3149 domain-containing protein [Zoogloeaceae bacterium]